MLNYYEIFKDMEKTAMSPKYRIAEQAMLGAKASATGTGIAASTGKAIAPYIEDESMYNKTLGANLSSKVPTDSELLERYVDISTRAPEATQNPATITADALGLQTTPNTPITNKNMSNIQTAPPVPTEAGNTAAGNTTSSSTVPDYLKKALPWLAGGAGLTAAGILGYKSYQS